MNCPEFRNRIIELLDGRNFTHEEQHHLEHCPDCAAEFRAAAEALDAVTPRSNPRASDNLRDRILTAAASAGHPRRNRIYRLLGTMAAAAAIFAGVLLLTVRTPAYAARKHFGCAAAVMNDLKTLRIALRIRTTPRENFTYTDPALPPIPCTVTVEYGDTLRWRIEKPGRTALCDGETARMWLRDAGEGWCSQADGYHPEGELGLLLDLQRLLLAEQAQAFRTKGAQYEIAEEDGSIRLTIRIPAQGDFSQSDYSLNSSITESNTLREYRFDKESGRLLDLRITAILPDGSRSVLLESTGIVYDEPVDRAVLTALPENIEWIDLAEPVSGAQLVDISAEEAANRILRAMGSWDETLLDEALHYYGTDIRKELEAHYGGLAVIAIGQAVRSGQYAGVFVPCEILLADGRTEKLMLALRNDNPEKCWLVDGGL
ncbi:hypothetical protein [uncultured Alistipes sp.]|uniref:hypothetical protein n=1 Tax=uncultured Alistipes sp. TaxID=538949 RepID=UPI002729A2A0|nr:hypothetical protein [uncultured Alistipes sp.]